MTNTEKMVSIKEKKAQNPGKSGQRSSKISRLIGKNAEISLFTYTVASLIFKK